jgi:hypothetical protein
MAASYTKLYSIEEHARGDTIRGFNVDVTRNGVPASVASARALLKTAKGVFTYEWPLTIVSGFQVQFPEISSGDSTLFPVGTLYGEMETVYTDGVKRTFMSIQLPIGADITNGC